MVCGTPRSDKPGPGIIAHGSDRRVVKWTSQTALLYGKEEFTGKGREFPSERDARPTGGVIGPRVLLALAEQLPEINYS